MSAERSDAAIERLEELLREHPYDARAAMTLARLLLESGGASRARELAQRAVRFGGGSVAEALAETIDAVREPDPTGDEATPPPVADSPPA